MLRWSTTTIESERAPTPLSVIVALLVVIADTTGSAIGASRAGGPGRSPSMIGPDTDVITFEREPDPAFHLERGGELAGELQPAGPVEHGVLLGDDLLGALLVQLCATQHLAARATVTNADGPVHLLGYQRVVGDHDDSDAELAVSPSQRSEHLGCRRSVQFAGRLIGEDNLRLVRDRPCDRDPLLLAAGKFCRAPLRAIVDAHQLQQLLHAVLPIRLRNAGEAHWQLDILRGSQVRQKVSGGLLPDEADDLAPEPHPLARRHRQRVAPGDSSRAGGGDVEPREDVEQRRFARA